jgi:hypothetical protein
MGSTEVKASIIFSFRILFIKPNRPGQGMNKPKSLYSL